MSAGADHPRRCLRDLVRRRSSAAAPGARRPHHLSARWPRPPRERSRGATAVLAALILALIWLPGTLVVRAGDAAMTAVNIALSVIALLVILGPRQRRIRR
jgi:type II secretory pathway component PulM